MCPSQLLMQVASRLLNRRLLASLPHSRWLLLPRRPQAWTTTSSSTLMAPFPALPRFVGLVSPPSLGSSERVQCTFRQGVDKIVACLSLFLFSSVLLTSSGYPPDQSVGYPSNSDATPNLAHPLTRGLYASYLQPETTNFCLPGRTLGS